MTGQPDQPAARDASRIASMQPRPVHLPTPVHPERAYEQDLVDIWQAELAFGPIGIDDDFFEFDGDSFAALNILASFEKLTGIELSPSLLTDNRTIRDLAARAREADAVDDGDRISTARDSG